MKNKLIAVLTAGAMVMGGGLSVFAQGEAESDEYIAAEEILAPRYAVLYSHKCSLSLTSNYNTLRVQGSTGVYSGYIAGVIVDLQQYNGGWNTIKTWSAGTYDSASVDEMYNVASGYKYRLQVTHISYDSNWNEIDIFTHYTSTVSR